MAGKWFFTKETFTEEENSRIEYSETEDLYGENRISLHHVLTHPSLQQKLQQFCVHLQSGVELELPSIPGALNPCSFIPLCHSKPDIDVWKQDT